MFGLIPFMTNSKVSNNGESFGDFIEKFFNEDNFFTPFGLDNYQNFNSDIRETENEYLVSAELPGVKKEDINLEYRDNTLIISAKRDEVIDNSIENYVRKERTYGEFSRCFRVDNVDRSKICAKFENGELKIILPKLNKTFNNEYNIHIQ